MLFATCTAGGAPAFYAGMMQPEFPTPWQRKTIWAALSALAVVSIGAIAVGLVWLVSRVLGFLQPILIPFAVAGVLAYLLDPVVSKIVSWGTSRYRAVMFVFAAVSLAFVGLLFWIVPALTAQTVELVHSIPRYSEQARKSVLNWTEEVRVKYHIDLLPKFPTPEAAADAAKVFETPKSEAAPVKTPAAGTAATAAPANATTAEVEATKVAPAADVDSGFDLQQILSGNWIRTALPAVVRNAWNFIRSSVGGFMGVFGFLVSMVIVPIYLYYFLIESRNISESWADYVPLRASHFKDEVISALEEINGYLIAFFRGQLIVSLINGTATGICLAIVGLDFGLLIGLLLCVLGLIPYLGITLCWIPAVLIASLHGDTWFLHGAPWWAFPLVVTGIFVAVQQIDGLFVTPKIVGESVGLHPMTVIFSVFVWSLLMGGLLGAILAVPMTATIKVLLRRYVWERRFKSELVLPTEESFAVQRAKLTSDDSHE